MRTKRIATNFSIALSSSMLGCLMPTQMATVATKNINNTQC